MKKHSRGSWAVEGSSEVSRTERTDRAKEEQEAAVQTYQALDASAHGWEASVDPSSPGWAVSADLSP